MAAYRYNCQPCKQRKTKCDRVKPCASCHLRGTQEKCYSDEHDGAETATSREDRPPKRARLSDASSKKSSTAGATSGKVSNASPLASPMRSLPAVAAPTASSSSSPQDQTSAIQDHIAMLRKTIDQLEASILPSSPSRKLSPSRNETASASQLILTTNAYVIWSDVAHLFPPKRDVERILDYFLRELVYIMIPVQEKQFWRAWTRLTRNTPPSTPSWRGDDQESDRYQSGISRSMVASLLICLASTSFLIPQRREQELELTRGMAEQRDHWITCALALGRCGASFNNSATTREPQQPWLHYIDATIDTSLDRFGFETLACRIFSLLGMSEMSYHLNGECLRRAIRINLYDEASLKASELLLVDDPKLTDEEVVQMRRRIGIQAVVTERWTCLYTGRRPMIDEDAEVLPTPAPGEWVECEEIAFLFSRFVSRLRRLPAQLARLTTRKPGDWSSQRARDQEAVQLILDIDRGLCATYDPSLPRPSASGRSHAQILAELPEILERNQHLSMSDAQINQLHRDFANALIMTSSWLSLRCLVTSNLMFLPWVSDVGSRYYALNLARRLIELLPSIWMMASSPYVPFSSSWISRHLFLACTVLSVPILGQEPAGQSAAQAYGDKDGGSHKSADADESAAGGGENGKPGDFAPSHLQSKQFFSKVSTRFIDGPATSQRLPASSSIDLDWFSGKLVEIASLFSKLAERGDRTAGVNTKLIHALLNGRAELRDRVLQQCGQKQNRATGIGMQAVQDGSGQDGAVGRIESQRDLTTFVMASSVGKSSPSSAATSPATTNGMAGSPVNAAISGSGGACRSGRVGRKDVLMASTRAEPQRIQSPSLHDLANAVDTYTSHSNATSGNGSATSYTSSMVNTPPLPSFSPHPNYAAHHHHHQQQQPKQQHQPSSGTTAGGEGGGGIGWDWDKTFLPTTPAASATAGGAASAGSEADVLANVPLLLDTQDWLAILDGVDIPL